MYQPQHFREPRIERAQALMRAHPLALLIVRSDTSLEANPLPLLLSADGTRLHGHVARANPLATRAADGEALAVFSGPQAYVSPGWYPSKREHGKAVPTWNYATVHVWGALRRIDDRDWLRAHVGALTATHEADQPQPWRLEDAPPDYLDAMLGAIVGLELAVTRIEAKFKLSQNRAGADREGVLAAYDAQGEAGAAIARAMRDAAGSN